MENKTKNLKSRFYLALSKILTMAILTSPLIAIAPCLTYQGCDEVRREQENRVSRRIMLDSLVKDIKEKAEFEDGKKGMSLQDMATMSHELGYEGIIYEGDRVYLNVVVKDSLGTPSINLNITSPSGLIAGGGYYLRDYSMISDKNARTYLEKNDHSN